jgi:hypothetical protein
MQVPGDDLLSVNETQLLSTKSTENQDEQRTKDKIFINIFYPSRPAAEPNLAEP